MHNGLAGAARTLGRSRNTLDRVSIPPRNGYEALAFMF
jgi:hypothetical protein